MAGEDLNLDTTLAEDAKKDLTNFQALFARVMNIPDEGRNMYQNWLASRWQEALANWGFSSEAKLNQGELVMDPLTGDQMWDPAAPDVPGSEPTMRRSVAKSVGEEFEDYLNRLKGSRDLFGGSTDAETGARTTGRRLDQLSAMTGKDQRAVFDAIGAKTGLGYDALEREAFLNANEARFGRRGSQVIAQQMFNPMARGRFDNRQLQAEALALQDPNASFLNERLDALRKRYGF